MSRGPSTLSKKKVPENPRPQEVPLKDQSKPRYYKAPLSPEPEIMDIELASLPFRETNPDRTEGAKKLGFLEAGKWGFRGALPKLIFEREKTPRISYLDAV
jgi:hypothetical protein